MNEDYIAASGMFTVAFLLLIIGFVIILGGVFSSLPSIFRIPLGAIVIVAAMLLARWYIRKI